MLVQKIGTFNVDEIDTCYTSILKCFFKINDFVIPEYRPPSLVKRQILREFTKVTKFLNTFQLHH